MTRHAKFRIVKPAKDKYKTKAQWNSLDQLPLEGESLPKASIVSLLSSEEKL